MKNNASGVCDIPSTHTLDSLSELEFNKMMAEGLAQAKANQGVDLDDAFIGIEICI